MAGVTPALGAGRLIWWGRDFGRSLWIEAPANGGRNYNGPKVAHLLSGKSDP